MTEEKETAPKDDKETGDNSDASANQATERTPPPDTDGPAAASPGDETGQSEEPAADAAPEDTNSAQPAAHKSQAPERHGDGSAAHRPGAVAPGGLTGLIILLLVASTIGGLIVALWPNAGSDRPGTALSADVEKRLNTAENRIASLQKQLDAEQKSTRDLEAAISAGQNGGASPDAAAVIRDIQNRVEALENTATQPGHGALPGTEETGAAGLNSLNQQVATLTARVQELEQDAPPPDLQERLDRLAPTDMVKQLSDRVTALEADKSGLDAQKAALTLAVANLAHATDNGEPFASELQALSLLAPDANIPQSVNAVAQTGVRSKQALIGEFGDLSFKALKADRQKAGANWIDQLQSNFDSVFSIRRKGEMEGQSTEAVLARADARLDKNDLAGAVSELKGLQGPAAETMAPWLQQANARLETERFLTRLNQMVVERLATDGSNP